MHEKKKRISKTTLKYIGRRAEMDEVDTEKEKRKM